MPFDNVTIEASWEKIDAPVSVEENPNTAAAMPATYCVLFGCVVGSDWTSGEEKVRLRILLFTI